MTQRQYHNLFFDFGGAKSSPLDHYEKRKQFFDIDDTVFKLLRWRWNSVDLNCVFGSRKLVYTGILHGCIRRVEIRFQMCVFELISLDCTDTGFLHCFLFFSVLLLLLSLSHVDVCSLVCLLHVSIQQCVVCIQPNCERPKCIKFLHSTSKVCYC